MYHPMVRLPPTVVRETTSAFLKHCYILCHFTLRQKEKKTFLAISNCLKSRPMFLKVLNFRFIMSTMFSAQVALVVVSLSSFHIFCVESRLHSDSSNNNHNSFRHRMNSLSSKLISSMGIDRMPNYKNVSFVLILVNVIVLPTLLKH